MDRLTRARSIAAAISKPVACSAKGDAVRFGLPSNRGEVPVKFSHEAFDAMTDEAVVAALRAAWGAR